MTPADAAGLKEERWETTTAKPRQTGPVPLGLETRGKAAADGFVGTGSRGLACCWLAASPGEVTRLNLAQLLCSLTGQYVDDKATFKLSFRSQLDHINKSI